MVLQLARTYGVNKATNGKRKRHMTEQQFMNESGVTVTNARAIINGTTYSMANVTSVSMGVIPAARGMGIVLFIIGGIIAAAADGGGSMFGALLALVGLAMAIFAKATYLVKLGSASGEATAMSSKDQGFISKIVVSLNEALIARG